MILLAEFSVQWWVLVMRPITHQLLVISTPDNVRITTIEKD